MIESVLGPVLTGDSRMPVPPMPTVRAGLIACLAVLCLFSEARAADQAAVKAAIDKGAQWLLSNGGGRGSRRALAALALFKAGVPASNPVIQEAIQEIQKRCQDGKYKRGNEHIYEAGVEATLLADIDKDRFIDELTLIRDYLLEAQLQTGAWDYPTGREGSFGDTSVTQYGCLGLWAISRAGIAVDPAVWKKVMDWHVHFQNADGGFAYCPRQQFGQYRESSNLNMSVNAVGNLHIAMMAIDPNFAPLRDKAPAPQRTAPEAPRKKYSFLETVDIDNKPQSQTRATSVSIAGDAISTVRRIYGWVEPRFRAENRASHHSAYYYYSLERMAALANVSTIGNRDWFNECADYVIQNQRPEGNWTLSQGVDSVCDTCFCILFLTRSTGKLLKRVPEPGYGDGTLAGGRGLPDDLADVEFNGREVKAKEKPTEPLDQLLASLMSSGEINLDDAQDQIVEQIQLSDRSELVGQIDQLLKLIEHPQADVRKLAVWAIGRSDRMDLAQKLIESLNDPDLGVIIEARNGLCWISRKPLGFGAVEDPLAALPPTASDEEKTAAIAAWHSSLITNWGQWYLDNRPFQQRGDQFETKLRLQLEQIRRASANAR